MSGTCIHPCKLRLMCLDLGVDDAIARVSIQVLDELAVEHLGFQFQFFDETQAVAKARPISMICVVSYMKLHVSVLLRYIINAVALAS